MVQLDRDPPYRWPDLYIRNSVLQSTMYLIIALPYCSPYQPIGSLPLNSGEFQHPAKGMTEMGLGGGPPVRQLKKVFGSQYKFFSKLISDNKLVFFCNKAAKILVRDK